jgi:predicted helicase
MLNDFYSYNYPHIKNKKTLVAELANQSFYYSTAIKEFVEAKENATEHFYIKFNALFSEYQKSINYHYQLDDFCDIYAQSLVYGLMLARLDKHKDLDEENLNYLESIPVEYKLLKEFLSQAYVSADLPKPLRHTLTNIGKNINMIDIEAIQKEFSKTGEGKQHIAIFLYENFLQEYDKLQKTKNRKESGVYYTPIEATNFITRGVNYLIKKKFNHRGYLADKVKVLDFACGTGTFLHSVFEEMLKENKDDLQKEIIKNKIENDIYGFELLHVPYIIAHTMLTRFLKKNGIELTKRLGVYLTNTLDIDDKRLITDFLPNLQNEYEKANNIKKNEHILAIIGNPPYSLKRSKIISNVIDRALQEYKKGVEEKRHALNDLYIKFILFAELKIKEQKQGIIGIITNNIYLDGLTHYMMRQHLYETFDEIYIVNLHGNSDKKEGDENIFYIKRGVSIIFLVKLPKPANKKVVKYFSTLDNKIITRPQKLDFLDNTKFNEVEWKTLNLVEPKYWFVEKNISLSLQKRYSKFWNLTNIFEILGNGIETQNDNIAIHYNKKNLDKVIDNFINLSEKEIAIKYQIKDGRDWKVSTAKNDLSTNKGKDFYTEVSYRPFDKRITYFTGKTKGFYAYPRYDTMRHVKKENFTLITKKQMKENFFANIFVTDEIVDRSFLESAYGGAFVIPLYLYQDNGAFGKSEKVPNFKVDFNNFLKTLNFRPNPEKILAYIYAVLHSPIYRKKYIKLLEEGFPAVPFTMDKNIFEKYAKLGQKLIDLHLLKEKPKDKSIKVIGDANKNFTIDKISHENKILYLHTVDNKKITFDGITQEIYNFEIGSYKPIDKWIEDRKDKNVTLTSKDLQHIKNMAIAIKHTIKIMGEIEELGEEYLEGV